VESFVGHGNAIQLTIKYDANEVIPLLMTIFDPPNRTIAVIIDFSLFERLFVLQSMFDGRP
jgi:hypothetical protein